jgi:hypothetical protein
MEEQVKLCHSPTGIDTYFVDTHHTYSSSSVERYDVSAAYTLAADAQQIRRIVARQR